VSLLVVGSVALDSVETPFGKVKDALGGSATYISTSAAFFTTPVRAVGVVGGDFPREYLTFLEERGIDLDGTAPPAKRRKTPPRKISHRSNNGRAAKKTVAAGRGNSAAGDAKPIAGKGPFTPTEAVVARLRKQSAMTRSQFAGLLGVGPQTVANWETKRGKLKLQSRTLKAPTREWVLK